MREDARLLLLLTPPFDKTTHDPGYIKGYLPGVRENGAQYTHAALWAVLATAMQRRWRPRVRSSSRCSTRSRTRARPRRWRRYKVEPYVVAADVYTAPGHVGRGGWTWYTGSASWMYRVGLEAILGFTRRGDRLTFRPAVPAEWARFGITYRFGNSTYAITVEEPGAVRDGQAVLVLDGTVQADASLRLVDDGCAHTVVLAPSVSRR